MSGKHLSLAQEVPDRILSKLHLYVQDVIVASIQFQYIEADFTHPYGQRKKTKFKTAISKTRGMADVRNSIRSICCG